MKQRQDAHAVKALLDNKLLRGLIECDLTVHTAECRHDFDQVWLPARVIQQGVKVHVAETVPARNICHSRAPLLADRVGVELVTLLHILRHNIKVAVLNQLQASDAHIFVRVDEFVLQVIDLSLRLRVLSFLFCRVLEITHDHIYVVE